MDYDRKANYAVVTKEFLAHREKRATGAGWGKAKWIEFCEAMMARGFVVELYEAKISVSKYINVWNAGKRFRVRFSNHGSSNNDCDFFVGKNRFGTYTTEQAIQATIFALTEVPNDLENTGRGGDPNREVGGSAPDQHPAHGLAEPAQGCSAPDA